MSRDLVVDANRDAVLDFGPITRRSESTGLAVAIDLSVASTKMWFTVKEAITDSYAAAIVKKTYVQGGSPDGFTITQAASIDPDVPNGTITISRAELDFDSRQSYYWDLTLEEPSGRRSTVDRGAFKIVLPVSDPP